MQNIRNGLAKAGAAALLIAAGVFIAPFENDTTDPAKLAVHADPIGIPTACYGSVKPGLKVGDIFTEEDCIEMLAIDLATHESQMMQVVKVPLSEQEFIAYLSFHYNIGAGHFRNSTLLRYLNAERRVEACNELSRWIYAKGVKWPGLVKRRAAERDLCLEGAINVSK